MARLLEQYNATIATAIASKFNLTNKMAIPKLDKIVINMGVSRATQDKALLEVAVDSLARISGQKPLITKAKVSVSGFRLREGNEIGCKVTLRGKRMYEFLDRLISIALPRIRDFRGVNLNSFDGHGNYTLGLSEQVVFPEIDADRLQHTRAWTSPLSPPRTMMTTPGSSCVPSACPSVNPNRSPVEPFAGHRRPVRIPKA